MFLISYREYIYFLDISSVALCTQHTANYP